MPSRETQDMSYQIKQDTNYSGDISTEFHGQCQSKLVWSRQSLT